MTYVISDIHGKFDKYKSMLRLIHLSSEDQLFILGDAIDRGPDGIKILKDAMSHPNIHMLMGNHELMAVETLFARDERTAFENMMLWGWNGGDITYDSLLALADEEREKIASFLLTLPTSMDIKVNGRKFHLVHGFPADDPKKQVWTRPDLNTPNPFTDRTPIIGHTPTLLLHGNTDEEAAAYICDLHKRGEHFKIEHAAGFIDIDCGCGTELPQARLACLRLDDMEEFYV